ncbi:hypothetical protein P3T22_006596 [Paraburkholderia sp. GAS348]
MPGHPFPYAECRQLLHIRGFLPMTATRPSQSAELPSGLFLFAYQWNLQVLLPHSA